MNLLRELIREQIKKLMQDDAIFRRLHLPGLERTKDVTGIEPEFDNPGDECPECEKSWPDPCPGHQTLCSVEPS
jgi:hypothetical protein